MSRHDTPASPLMLWTLTPWVAIDVAALGRGTVEVWRMSQAAQVVTSAGDARLGHCRHLGNKTPLGHSRLLILLWL